MRLTNQFSVMGRKYDLAFGQANTWKRKLKNDKYELIENAIDKLGQYEDIDESPKHLAIVSKVLEIIKEIDFLLEFDASQNEWSLYIPDEEKCILVAKGTGIKTYDLLKEALL